MAGNKVIYASNVKRRTAAILRTFAYKNGRTFSELMDILSHIVSGVPTEKLFDGKAGELDPRYTQFDQMLREFMEDKMPEEYRKVPVIRRVFGRMFKPVTKQDLDKIDKLLEEENLSADEPVEVTEVPDVEGVEDEYESESK